MFSEAMFDKSYSSQGGHPTDIAFKTSQKEALPFVNILKENYKPKRRFRRTEKLSFASSAAHVQYVLLEYGDHGGTAGAGTSAAGEGDDASVAALQALAAASGTAGVNVDGEDGEEEEEDEDLVDESMRNNLQAAGSAAKASKGNVGGLVAMQADEISRAKSEYEAQQEAGDAFQERLGLADAHKRQVSSLEKQVAVFEMRASQLKELEAELKADIDALMGDLRKLSDDNENIVTEMEHMEGLETDDNKADLARLKALVILNENLKQQESKFKVQCKKQMKALQEKIAGVGADDGDEDELRRLQQIEEVYAKDLAKFTRVRQLLAQKNQEISFIQRKIDDIPTRTELVQYERRFVELHDQVASKLDETKKHYNTYNNLTDRTEFLDRELNLLDTVYQKYSSAMGSQGAKEKFVEELARIHADVEKSVGGVAGNLTKLQTERTALQDEYNVLMDNQRAYFKACKDFQDECTKNEYLQSKTQQQ